MSTFRVFFACAGFSLASGCWLVAGLDDFGPAPEAGGGSGGDDVTNSTTTTGGADCIPDCANKTCGQDGCGDECGPGCGPGELCAPDDSCAPCAPWAVALPDVHHAHLAAGDHRLFVGLDDENCDGQNDLELLALDKCTGETRDTIAIGDGLCLRSLLWHTNPPSLFFGGQQYGTVIQPFLGEIALEPLELDWHRSVAPANAAVTGMVRRSTGEILALAGDHRTLIATPAAQVQAYCTAPIAGTDPLVGPALALDMAWSFEPSPADGIAAYRHVGLDNDCALIESHTAGTGSYRVNAVVGGGSSVFVGGSKNDMGWLGAWTLYTPQPLLEIPTTEAGAILALAVGKEGRVFAAFEPASGPPRLWSFASGDLDEPPIAVELPFLEHIHSLAYDPVTDQLFGLGSTADKARLAFSCDASLSGPSACPSVVR